MYTSPLFQKMMAHARSLNPKRIFILSAKYGLLNPDDMIEPYEQTLKTMKLDERQRWAGDVLLELARCCDLIRSIHIPGWTAVPGKSRSSPQAL